MSKQVHVSHALCDHDKTPKARAVCRRIRRGGAPETSKAEIVARVKGEDITPVRTTIQSSKKSNKRSKKAKAPVLRELLTLDNDTYPNSIANEDELSDHNVFSSKHGKNIPLKELEAAEACEQDDVKVVQMNVIAKGSKVVHVMIVGGVFACTKRPINIDTAKITTNDVTCKNCLKITK